MNQLLSIVPLFLIASCVADQRPKSAINVFGGSRSIGNNDFDGVNDPIAWGGELIVGLNRRGLSLEGGFIRAEDDDDVTLFGSSGDGEVVTDELFAGLRNTWNTDSTIQPYIGGGVSWVDTKVDVDGGFHDDDGSVAGYVRAGLGFQFQSFQVGVDGRVMFGSDLELEGNSTDIDYYQVLAFVGFSW